MGPRSLNILVWVDQAGGGTGTGLQLAAGAPPPYSAEVDSPTLGNGRSGPNALSAKAAALPQASRNEPNASFVGQAPMGNGLWGWPAHVLGPNRLTSKPIA